MKKFFKQKNKKEGFTLVETLIAIAIFSMSILALMSVLGSGIADTSYAKQKTIASYLAEEGIEAVRNFRDNYLLYGGGNNWTNFISKLVSCNRGEGNGCGINSTFATTDNRFIFKCSDTARCNLYLDNGDYNVVTGNDSGFVREIWMENMGDDEVKIYSTVSWRQGSGSYSITLSGNLYNWIEY
ncbi:prepilin-type N-terminal cleavage/methylation domain-containing protein [Candidatus Nomurabacteria bacterium]|nr:prepilin-type N-terminal cleavage/methylation domain-containing protein [Candidatus Nomurabacteria bacterium]